MSVATTHPQYDAAAARWARVRDVVAGSDALKARAMRWLPKPAAMGWEDYAAYVERAPFFPATSRTLAAFVGEIARKDPVVERPDRLAALDRDADLAGRPLATFAIGVADEVLTVGRHAVLTEWSDEANRPYLAVYAAEDLVNWRSAQVDGAPRLVMAVLRETATAPREENRFATRERERYRLLELMRDGSGRLACAVTLFEKRENEREPVRVSGPIFPTRRGKPLDFIPLTIIGATDLGPEVGEAPMLALADLNVSHWRTAADLEHALFYCGSPLIAISGRLVGGEANDAPSALAVGPGTALHLELNGRAEMLQASADSVGALRQALQDKQQGMAVIGARMLAGERAGNPEAHQSVALRYRSEDATLASVAKTVGRGLTRALKVAAWWAGAADSVEDAEASVALNTDFTPGEMGAAELLNLVSAFQSGLIGRRAAHAALLRGEMLPEDLRDYEAYRVDALKDGANPEFDSRIDFPDGGGA